MSESMNKNVGKIDPCMSPNSILGALKKKKKTEDSEKSLYVTCLQRVTPLIAHSQRWIPRMDT